MHGGWGGGETDRQICQTRYKRGYIEVRLPNLRFTDDTNSNRSRQNDHVRLHWSINALKLSLILRYQMLEEWCTDHLLNHVGRRPHQFSYEPIL